MDCFKKWGRPGLLSLILIAASLIAFWPILHNGFIDLDDGAYVWRNPHVLTGLTWANIEWAFRSGYQGNWHPLTWLSHMLDAQLFGVRPGWHHAMNLALHTANALLLFTLFERLTGSRWRSFFVAGLFAVHPLHVESVAWAAERKDVLSAFFFMLTLLAYEAWARSGNRRAGPAAKISPYYILSLVCFTLGLMSKPMLVTLPFVLLLLDFWPLERFGSKLPADTPPPAPPALAGAGFANRLRALCLEKIPFFCLSAVSCWLTWEAQTRWHATHLQLPLACRAANAVESYCDYLGQTVWPAKMAAFYPHPDIRYPVSLEWPAWALGAGLLALVAVSAGVLLGRKRMPWLVTGWFWYLGMLVPVIGLVQAGAQGRADRYTYLPLIGIFFGVIWTLAALMRPKLANAPGTRRFGPHAALIGAGCLALAACTALTHRQAGYWKDTLTLFNHALDVTSNNSMAEFLVGGTLKERGQTNAAMAHLQAAVADDPSFADAHYQLGLLLEEEGKPLQAVEQHEAALRAMPWLDWAHNHLGKLYWELGRQKAAEDQFTEALRWQPENSEAHFNLGLILASRGDYAEAANHFAAVLRQTPGDSEARKAMQEALLKLNGNKSPQRAIAQPAH